MRTTIRVDDELLKRAKQHAARTGQSLTHLIEDALRQSLTRSEQAPRRKHTRLPTMDGHGVLPGVDLDNAAALLDLMERSS